MGGWVDEQMDGWVGGWLGGWTGGWMGGWLGGWVDRCPPALSLQLPQHPAPHKEAASQPGGSREEAWHDSCLLPQVLPASPRRHRVPMPRPPALSEVAHLYRSGPPFL